MGLGSHSSHVDIRTWSHWFHVDVRTWSQVYNTGTWSQVDIGTLSHCLGPKSMMGPGPIGPKLAMGPGPIGPKLMMGPCPIGPMCTQVDVLTCLKTLSSLDLITMIAPPEQYLLSSSSVVMVLSICSVRLVL